MSILGQKPILWMGKKLPPKKVAESWNSKGENLVFLNVC